MKKAPDNLFTLSVKKLSIKNVGARKAYQDKILNIDNITENTIIINSQGNDPRLKYVMERLVTHLHDFARETRLSTSEWMAALNFLVRVGQISSDVRHV